MINLEWLRTFNAIYECNNITAASKKLFMTQPGVSKHLSALENHIGKKLFHRTTRKMEPTEYGKFLYAQTLNPLQQLEKVEHYSNQRTSKTRAAITIGCSSDVFETYLAQHIYNFDMYIATQFGKENEMFEALESEAIQLLVGAKKHPTYKLQYELFKNEELVLICSEGIEIPTDIQLHKKQFSRWAEKQTWFVYDNNQNDIKQFWSIIFNAQPQIVPRYILPSYSSIIKALKQTLGFAIVPKHLCDNDIKNNLIKHPMASLTSIKQELFYSYKLKNRDFEAITEFKDMMRA